MTLTAHQLAFSRDDLPLFEGLELSLAAGELLQVEGPNGSGKTTLLRILCGLLQPLRGEVCWCGQPIQQVRAEYGATLAYLGHRSGLKETLTPRENLHAALAIYGAKAVDVEAALAGVGLAHLDEELPCRVLSAGQQRRVALARLVASGARLWVLDEPFTALDRAGRRLVEQLLMNHLAQGGMAVVTTHHVIELAGSTVRELRLG